MRTYEPCYAQEAFSIVSYPEEMALVFLEVGDAEIRAFDPGQAAERSGIPHQEPEAAQKNDETNHGVVGGNGK